MVANLHEETASQNAVIENFILKSIIQVICLFKGTIRLF